MNLGTSGVAVPESKLIRSASRVTALYRDRNAASLPVYPVGLLTHDLGLVFVRHLADLVRLAMNSCFDGPLSSSPPPHPATEGTAIVTSEVSTAVRRDTAHGGRAASAVAEPVPGRAHCHRQAVCAIPEKGDSTASRG
jgi:hypothetical protein